MFTDTSKPASARDDSLALFPTIRFTVRQLLLVTMFVSIVMAILFGFTNWFASVVLIMLAILAPAVLTAAVVYGRGEVRAFCIGALFPTAMMAMGAACVIFVIVVDSGALDRLDRSAAGLRFAFMLLWALAALSGWFSVIVSRHFARQQPQ